MPATRNLGALQTALLVNLPPMLADLTESLDAQPVTLADVPPALVARRQTADGRVLVEAFPKADLRDQVARRAFADAVQAAVPEATGEAVAADRSRTRRHPLVLRSRRLYLRADRGAAADRSAQPPRFGDGDGAAACWPALMTVATTVVIDVPFNFANVIVLPLLFGLGVSSGINMAVRGRQQGSRSLLVTSTPRAVLFSALTTIGSFGSLAISEHPGMASMGLLLTVALIYTTLCTLTVLPALRDVFGPDRRHRRPAPHRADAAVRE